MTDNLRIISYGGGVQSTALLVLAGTGKLDDLLGGPVTHAIFSNVGDDSETPDSIDYVRNVATPWAADRNITVVEVRRAYADGRPYASLMQNAINDPKGNSPLPVFAETPSAPGMRACTSKWKIGPVTRWLKENGATPENRATICIGISVDEIERAGRGRNDPMEIRKFPLLDLGLNRGDCQTIIADAGLPVPGKSSCFFCPFHSRRGWGEMRRDNPDQFEASANMESTVNEHRLAAGRRPVYLTQAGKPLREAIVEMQSPLFDVDGPDGCSSGTCWT